MSMRMVPLTQLCLQYFALSARLNQQVFQIVIHFRTAHMDEQMTPAREPKQFFRTYEYHARRIMKEESWRNLGGESIEEATGRYLGGVWEILEVVRRHLGGISEASRRHLGG